MSHDTFDKTAWLRSMLYESGNHFALAIADQVELVRNEAEAEAAFWRAMRFPDVVSKLTYDYDADVPLQLDADEWWNSDTFQRAAGAEWAEQESRRLKLEQMLCRCHRCSTPLLGSKVLLVCPGCSWSEAVTVASV